MIVNEILKANQGKEYSNGYYVLKFEDNFIYNLSYECAKQILEQDFEPLKGFFNSVMNSEITENKIDGIPIYVLATSLPHDELIDERVFSPDEFKEFKGKLESILVSSVLIVNS
jgi:hypothetical protein